MLGKRTYEEDTNTTYSRSVTASDNIDVKIQKKVVLPTHENFPGLFPVFVFEIFFHKSYPDLLTADLLQDFESQSGARMVLQGAQFSEPDSVVLF